MASSPKPDPGILAALSKALFALSKALDELSRFADLSLRRTSGGWLQQRLRIDGHPFDALLWAAVVAAAIVTGMPVPGFRLFLLAISFAVAGLVFYFFLRRWPAAEAAAAVQAVLLLAIGAIVWLAGGQRFQPRGIYRHVLIPMVWITAFAVIAAIPLGRWFFAGWRKRSTYPASLEKTELFQSRGASTGFTLGAVLNLLRPFHLLLPPAIAAMLLPAALLEPGTRAAFVSSAFLLLLCGLNSRLDWIYTVCLRPFFQNSAFLVSLAAIALGAARYAGSTYVTTIFDTAQGAEIFLVLVFIYAVSWWFDYWTQRMMGQHLLRIIDPGAGSCSQVAYPLDEDRKATSVPHEDRYLQIHGKSRFLVLQETGGFPYFHSWSYLDAFQQLAAAGTPGGKAKPIPEQIAQRVQQYKALLAALVAGLVLGGAQIIHIGVQNPALEVQSGNPSGAALARLLFEPAAKPNPAILMAASGGGTRAALYTAAVLEGLHKLGHSKSIVLGSGVSGGGASLAYFAANRPQLTAPDGPWDLYFSTMRQPFIQDVIEQASEWRIATADRLGVLLAQSFENRWKLPETRDQMGEISDFGLILNCALAGHFDRSRAGAPPVMPFLDVERTYRHLTSSELSGGRLILTNLALEANFTGAALPLAQSQPLPIVVNDRGVRLERAAALNANFPPVFSNAAIDLDQKLRFWVTDGGAADNRGLEMLLYASRSALLDRLASEPKARLPRLFVVVAEASAFDNSYQQDRGIGTVAGAGSQFAAQLDSELLDAIRDAYHRASQPGDVSFHYLPMPGILRASGTFGTHWMLQDRIRVTRDGRERILRGEEAITILRALHSSFPTATLSADALAILEWARQDKTHHAAWDELRTALSRLQ